MKQVTLVLCAAFLLPSCVESIGSSEMDWQTDDLRATDSDTVSGTDWETETASETTPESRGALTDFPTDSDCIDNCQEACAKVRECDGERSAGFPLPEGDECAERCILALDGPMWDDATVSFRCCATQDECSAVKTCGGWLAHPVTAHPCERLCECLFGGADLSSLWQGLTAPEGYTFARDAVAVAMDDHTTAFDLAYGATVHSLGRRLAFLDLSNPATALSVNELLSREVTLPTFRDPMGRLSAATGKLVVRLAAHRDRQDLQDAAADAGLTLPKKARFSPDLFVLEAADPWQAVTTLPKLIARLGNAVELDMVRLYERRSVPNDPFFSQQWHLRNTGQSNVAMPGVDSRVSEAWDLTQGSPSTIIAVLDDGVDVEHPDLAPNVVGSTNFPEDWRDQMAVGNFGWHGTSCAGVAVARGNNGEGVSGVCPQCALHGALLGGDAGLTPGSGMQVTDQEMAELFGTLVDAGAAVISNSWGLEGEDPRVANPSVGSPALPSLVSDSFDYAETHGRDGKGTVLLFAAGNSNMDVGRDPYASYKSVVAVAAVDEQGLKSYYSNWGKELLVAGPSSGGLLGIVTTATEVGGDLQKDPAYTASFGGTSSACPFVAGVAGLVISANPLLSASEVRRALADGARQIDPVNARYGKDGHSYYYGHGLVDAYRSVRLAQAKATGSSECADEHSCLAPSDAPCGSSCETSGSCSFCRTNADCGSGRCQALPELGRTVCVQLASGACPTNHELVGDYCQPTRQACDLCDEAEACDGRDNDCNGVWDDGEDCRGGFCNQAMRGCEADEGCAGVNCGTTCLTDDDCDAGRCKAVKDRYGAVHSDIKICYGGGGSCLKVCQAIVSSRDDEALQGFLDCMAPDTCDAAYGCISQM